MTKIRDTCSTCLYSNPGTVNILINYQEPNTYYEPMKVFVMFLLISVLIGLGLTFVLFSEHDVPSDPIREQYTRVFRRFGQHAENVYRQFDDTYGLDILDKYDAEGLRILLQYESLLTQLHPHIDPATLVTLCRTDGECLTEFLTQFQPSIIADIYSQFGLDALRYVLERPERYFQLQKYGDTLVQLADTKGAIMFELIRTYEPEFLELYYDDALFTAIQYAGLDGLLAMKTYKGMASTLFEHFGDDPRLTDALRTYGYRQIIPVLHYFYQQSSALPIYERIQRVGAVNHLENESESPISSPDTADALSHTATPYERVRWALQHIQERGHAFLRQFMIDEAGVVTPLPAIAVTNFLEELLLGASPSMPRLPQSAQDVGESLRSIPVTCEQFGAALNILGLLPPNAMFTQQTACTYLRNGLTSVRTREGIDGLLALDEQQEIIERYGAAVVPFVSQYGRKGLQLVQATDGTILTFEQMHGQDVTSYAIQYGPDVVGLVNEFGSQMIDAIRKTSGDIIPYARTHGSAILQLLNHSEGDALISLIPVFGDTVIDYVLQYPNDFPRYLFQYGHDAINAATNYEREIITLAGKRGDDAIFYAGHYGEDAVSLIKQGTIGITLLRVLPEEQLTDVKFLERELPRIYLTLLTRSPHILHAYIGALSQAWLPLPSYYAQIGFWMLLSLIVLYLLRWIYKLITNIFF